MIQKAQKLQIKLTINYRNQLFIRFHWTLLNKSNSKSPTATRYPQKIITILCLSIKQLKILKKKIKKTFIIINKRLGKIHHI